MKYYIATKLENHQAHNNLRDWLTLFRAECTYDWTSHGPVYRHGVDRIREVANLETQGVLDADVVIVLWPGGRGTHVELGMAIAAGKRVFLMSAVDGHHEASPETCAFYHHPLVTLSKSDVELCDQLRPLAYSKELGNRMATTTTNGEGK